MAINAYIHEDTYVQSLPNAGHEPQLIFVATISGNLIVA